MHGCVQVTMLMLMLMPGKDIKSLGTRVISVSGTPAFCMGAGIQFFRLQGTASVLTAEPSLQPSDKNSLGKRKLLSLE